MYKDLHDISHSPIELHLACMLVHIFEFTLVDTRICAVMNDVHTYLFAFVRLFGYTSMYVNVFKPVIKNKENNIYIYI